MGIPQMTRRYPWAWYTALRDANCNAVRLHAQPFPSFYLDVADEMGILVLDESAMWASDGGQKLGSEEFWKCSEELIADEYGVSRTYLNRKIKAITGDTTLKFIRNIRFKYAAQLLQSGEKNVSETAWEIGYNDVNTFRLRFKEMFGVTPTSYLKGKSEDERP